MKTIPLSKLCGWNVPFAKALLPAMWMMMPAARATTFYWNGSGDLALTSNWGINLDGTGAHPANFTDASQVFQIQTGQSPVLGGPWTIGGTGSSLAISAGGNFTNPANLLNAPIQLQSGATFINSDNSYSEIGDGSIFDPSSVFRLDNNSGMSTRFSYGDLVLNGTQNPNLKGSKLTVLRDLRITNAGSVVLVSSSGAGSATIGRDLILSAGAFNLTNGTASSLASISGTLTNNGGTIRGGIGTGTISFVGSTESEVKWGSQSGTFNVIVGAGRAMTFTDSLNNGTGILTVDGKLSGDSSIAGATIISGTHAPGASGVGTQTFSSDLSYADGSIFEWDLNADSRDSGFDTVAVSGSVTGASANGVFRVVLGDDVNFDLPFWSAPNATQTWTFDSIFGKALDSGGFQSIEVNRNVSQYGSFSVDGSGVTWSAVPEPSSAMVAFLIAAGALRRKRRGKSLLQE